MNNLIQPNQDSDFAFKLMIVFIVLYVLSPIDFVPDAIPVLGQADDLAAIAFGVLVSLVRWLKKGSSINVDDLHIVDGDHSQRKGG